MTEIPFDVSDAGLQDGPNEAIKWVLIRRLDDRGSNDFCKADIGPAKWITIIQRWPNDRMPSGYLFCEC